MYIINDYGYEIQYLGYSGDMQVSLGEHIHFTNERDLLFIGISSLDIDDYQCIKIVNGYIDLDIYYLNL